MDALGRVRARHGAFVLASVAGVVAFLVATLVFPYRSINHDEAVYLQQAAMLLEGQLFLYPPVEEAFDPWFFVDAESPNGPAVPVPERPGDVLYSKYAPPTAAVFALGKLLGASRFALAGVAAACVYLTYAVTREAFGERTGLLAGVFLLASPLFLVQVGTFLPYAPTTAFNLLFMLAYFRAEREGSVRWAAVAGGAVGIAFFARPYTAVLFAVPLIAHAAWTLWRRRTAAVDELWHHPLVRRRVATIALGLVGVAVTLGYNVVVTGHAFVFPYQAFAPLDGLGFGHREILGYDRNYTVALALEANRQVVETLFTDWVVAGPVGTLLAAGGVGAFLARRDDWRRGVLAGLFVSVIVGNVAFWGNLNVLGGIADPDDGLVYFLGPYYHFDLLVPTAAFAAHSSLTAASTLRDRVVGVESVDASTARRVTVALLLVASAAVAGAAATEASGPLQRNDQVSEQLAMGYEPFAEREFENALVYLPTPYGPWLNHPFQVLRNDPGFDGDAVYALDGIRTFDVADEFENRTKYRYVYRGSWVPTDDVPVEATLQRVHVVRSDRIVVDAAVGLPAGTESASIRVGTEEGHAYYAVEGTPETLPFRIVVADGTVELRGAALRHVGAGNASVPLDDRDAVEVTVFVDRGPGAEFSYRLRLPVDRTSGAVQAITPYLEYCDRPRLCGGEAAYVGDAPRGIFVEAQLVNASTTG